MSKDDEGKLKLPQMSPMGRPSSMNSLSEDESKELGKRLMAEIPRYALPGVNIPSPASSGDDALAYYAAKDGKNIELPKKPPDLMKVLEEAYDKELTRVNSSLSTNYTSKNERIAAQQAALERMRKFTQKAEAAHGRKLSKEELASVIHGISAEHENAKASMVHRLEKRVQDLEKALKEAGTKDPLLVATSEVLADENKRLTAEVERLMEEQAELRRRLDEAHNRLYKTIDILQERASGSTTQRPEATPEDSGQEEAQEARGSSHGAEQAARGGEHDAEGGQRQAPQESEGPRGENSRSLSVVGGARS
jgi:hypothetical protein